MATELHEQRLDRVVDVLLGCKAVTVLDLGCGPGELLVRLAHQPRFEKIIGVDSSAEVLQEARDRLTQGRCEPDGARLSLYRASLTDFVDDFVGMDAVAMVEVIEHVAPDRLSLVERAVFSGYRPTTVIITTPNSEYNPLHGMMPGQKRHPDHYFEWDRNKFRRWSQGVAQRNGYRVTHADLGEADPCLGGSSQMAVFTRST